MDAVEDILAAYGYDDPLDLGVDDLVKVEREEASGMMPLSIERVGERRISVAHTYVQQGDLMYDPEIVYEVSEPDRGWVPVRFTQHPFIEQYDPDGLDLDGFPDTWNKNLRSQGYVEAAQEQGGR